MISGIYSAVFASNNTDLVGRGVAIFSGNAIYGGNVSFYYKGKYKLDVSNTNVSAQVEVVHLLRNPGFSLRSTGNISADAPRHRY